MMSSFILEIVMDKGLYGNFSPFGGSAFRRNVLCKYWCLPVLKAIPNISLFYA